jgi:hypothetical protein
VEARGAQNLRVIILGYIALLQRRDAQVRLLAGVCVKPRRVKLCGYHSVKVKVEFKVEYL